MDPITFFLAVLAVVALEVVAYLIIPKPASPKPAAAQDAQAPTASAGKPMPVVFGTITVKGTNVLWWGDKSTLQYTIDS